jgi:hypothetical protein
MKELMKFFSAIQSAQAPFSFREKKCGLKITQKKQLDQKGVDLFFDYLEKKLASIDYLQLDAQERRCIQALNLLAEQFTQEFGSKKLTDRLWRLNLAMNEGVLTNDKFDFQRFIQASGFHEAMLILTKRMHSDDKNGLYLPVFVDGIEKWIPINLLSVQKKDEFIAISFNKTILFELNEDYTLSQDYLIAYRGIQKCNVYTSQELEVYDVKDPKEWGSKYILEVSVVSQRTQRPSMLYQNHAYLVLKDDRGNMRSVGQDILVYFKEPRYLQAFGYKRGDGLITSPDISVFASLHKMRISSVTVEVKKSEHDKILEIVKRDMRDLDRLASLLRSNCASYVARLLRLGAKIEVDPFMSAIHIFIKHFIPKKLYRGFKKISSLPKWFKRLLFYTPPIYTLQVVIGLSSYIMSKRSLRGKRDFSLLDLFIRPYKVGADHPLKLIREMEKEIRAIKKPPLRGRGR